MKKLLSIAIAAAVSAPMAANADTTIYGLIDNALTHNDNGTTESWDVEQGNGVSRLGVKGNEDLGNGLKAIFQYEWATQTTEGGSTQTGFTNRLGYVGLTGGFGTVTIGRQWAPYYGAVGKTDIMNAPSAGFRQNLNNYRTGNALAYMSPSMNGFSAGIAFVIDQGGATDIEDGVDSYHLALKYDNGPLSVGLGYRSIEATGAATLATTLTTTGGGTLPFATTIAAVDDSDTWGISAKYNFGNFAVVGAYEDQDNGTAGDVDAWSLGGEAYFGNNTVRALFGNTDNGATDTDAWAIGVQHNFSKRTRVYAEYADQDANGTDSSEFALGLRHDF
jgi:predicted porin